MSSFSFPDLPASEIVAVLKNEGCAPANLRPEDISRPSPDLLPSIFSLLLHAIDPLAEGEGDDGEAMIGFNALQVLDNPEYHEEAIRVFGIYRKARELMSSLRFPGFTLRDFLRPDPKRVLQVLSAIVNFLCYREDKLNLLKPIVNEFPNSEERRMELKAKIAELNKAISDHELAAQMEEPIVQQVDAEVKELKQSIQNFNKQQMTLKTHFKALTEKKEALIAKISSADYELLKVAQENSKLLSQIVQSPDKLQRDLEEKKTARTELKNSERLAMQSVQEKTATLEIYTKAYEKMSKHFSKVHAIQEQVITAKNVEKEVKALKSKLSDESVSIMSLEAKIVERQGKVNEAEELLKAREREKDQRLADETQRLNTVRVEMEWKLQCLEPRERDVEAMVAKGDNLLSEAESVRAAGKANHLQLQTKLEEIVQAFHFYVENVGPSLQMVNEVEKEIIEAKNAA